jgi:DNA-binding response OmpR family regulator
VKIVLVGENPGALLTMARATFTVDHAIDGEELADLLATFTYDAVVLDRVGSREVLPRIGQVRAGGKRVPILAVGVDETVLRIACLREGADDVVARQTAPEEVLARVTALIRRASGHDRASLVMENLTIDLAAQSASADGQRLDLTGKEFKLLRFLVLRAGSVLDKQQVLNALYTSDDEPDDRIVGVYLCTLRRKLRDAGVRITISTMRGLGYILRPGADEEVRTPAPFAIRVPVAARLGMALEHAMA